MKAPSLPLLGTGAPGRLRGAIAWRVRCCLGVVVLLGACNCGGDQISAATPAVTLSPAILDFGQVAVGTTASLRLSVTDSGRASLHVSAFPLTGDTAVFRVSPESLTVSGSNSATVEVTFAPPAVQAYVAHLTVTSDATNVPVPVELKGEGVTCVAGTTKSCGNACGNEGTETCGQDNQWESCDASAGACRPGATETCTNTCGSSGTRTCQADCDWGACNASPGACAPGATQSCQNSCQNAGTQTCGASCEWGACDAAAGICSPGQTQACNTSCPDGSPRPGTETCSSDCFWESCIPNPSPWVWNDFAMTPCAYPDTDDLAADCADVYGSQYTVADWSQLVALAPQLCDPTAPTQSYPQTDATLTAFSQALGIAPYVQNSGSQTALVVWQASGTGPEKGYYTYDASQPPDSSADRHYFIARHDKSKAPQQANPPFLIHACVDSDFFDLGSWNGLKMRILCHKS